MPLPHDMEQSQQTRTYDKDNRIRIGLIFVDTSL